MTAAGGQQRKPSIIIWTLQRSGGTNFANRLSRYCSGKIHHEPFNKQRAFGHVTREWMAAPKGPARDTRLLASMNDVLAPAPCVKHCVEMVPLEISHALAEAVADREYRHLLLYRRSIVDRLMSLYFARQTGIWGPASVAQADKELLEGTLPEVRVDELIEHEHKCIRNLSDCEATLQSLNIPCFTLCFEDIYDRDNPDTARDILIDVLSFMGIELDETEFETWFESMRSSGEQGTRARYATAPGYERLVKRAEEITPFVSSGVTPKLQ